MGLSVSRIGNKVQSEAMRQVAGSLKAEYARYRELLSLTRVRTKLSPEVEAQLNKGEALCELFVQDKNTVISQVEQIILFYAFIREVPELVLKEKRKKFREEIFEHLNKKRPELIERIAGQRILTEEIKRELDEEFQRFFYS